MAAAAGPLHAGRGVAVPQSARRIRQPRHRRVDAALTNSPLATQRPRDRHGRSRPRGCGGRRHVRRRRPCVFAGESTDCQWRQPVCADQGSVCPQPGPAPWLHDVCQPTSSCVVKSGHASGCRGGGRRCRQRRSAAHVQRGGGEPHARSVCASGHSVRRRHACRGDANCHVPDRRFEAASDNVAVQTRAGAVWQRAVVAAGNDAAFVVPAKRRAAVGAGVSDACTCSRCVCPGNKVASHGWDGCPRSRRCWRWCRCRCRRRCWCHNRPSPKLIRLVVAAVVCRPPAVVVFQGRAAHAVREHHVGHRAGSHRPRD